MVKQHLTDLSQMRSKIQELELYSLTFPFFHFECLNERCGKVIIKDQIYYIIDEKECFFVVEDQSTSSISSNFSNHTKKIKTEVYISKNQKTNSSKIHDSYEAKEAFFYSNKELNRNNSATAPSFLGKLKKKLNSNEIQLFPN